MKHPRGPQGEHTARDDGKEADKGQGHEGRVPDAHDPGGAHDGHGVHEEKRCALEPLAQRVHRDGKTDETPGREHLDGVAREKPREDDHEGEQEFGDDHLRTHLPGRNPAGVLYPVRHAVCNGNMTAWIADIKKGPADIRLTPLFSDG